MKPMHSDRMIEATKKRREYLQKKTVARTSAMFCGMGAAFLGLLTLLCVVGFLAVTFQTTPGAHRAGNYLFGAVFFGSTALFLGKRSRALIQQARLLRHVPPVAEQIADLPAEEVLLRGSDQPTARPEELLRAATAEKVEPSEMLRANEGRV